MEFKPMKFKIFLFFEKLLMILPEYLRRKFFTFLSYVVYKKSPIQRRISHQNLRFIFGEKFDDKERDSMIKFCFKNLVFNVMHLMEVRKMTKKDIRSKVSVENIEVVNEANNRNRPIIYVSPHCGSWELGLVSISVFDKPVNVVFTELASGQLQEWMNNSRGKFGNKCSKKTNVIKPLIKSLQNNESILMVIDSSMNKKDGVNVNFLGKDTKQTPAPAYLARKFNAAIIPFTITTQDEKNYTLKFFKEIYVNKSSDKDKDILDATQMQASWMTSLIMDDPKCWFWIHRRWRNEHPNIYDEIPEKRPSF